jgi:2-polyprenyl-3-methyl-5-hydroxy-6-metoxy-1,4-benzoquinol methylase
MVNYDAVYGGKTPLGGRPPWDIGQPQPQFVALEETRVIRGDVLDAGCGTGEHTLFLASRGHAVTGVDISAVAVDKARGKARERGVQPEFVVGDAFELPGHHSRFDTVVDCGLLDVCPDERQSGYAAALHRACRPGAHVYMLELSAESTELMRKNFMELGVPERHLSGLPRLTEDDLRRAFADGWDEEWLEEGAMRVSMPGTPQQLDVPALWAAYRRR